MPSSEIDRGRYIVCVAGQNCKSAFLERPSTEPATALREPDLISEIVGILAELERLRCRSVSLHERRLGHNETTVESCFKRIPLSSVWPARFARSNARRECNFRIFGVGDWPGRHQLSGSRQGGLEYCATMNDALLESMANSRSHL